MPEDRPASSRFTLGKPLGEGGMATVREAEDRTCDRLVAVKTLKPDLARDPDLRARFHREARILAGLAHPGMVPVYDAGALEDGTPFYAMQRVRGRTLAQMLRSRSPGQVRDRHVILKYVDILQRACEAVGYAHAKEILHRDLKPANIMVDDEFGAVLVMDWGLAKRLPAADDPSAGEQTQVGVLMGTPGYMSPEHLLGLSEASDPRTDVYALGVILYEILTGVKAFAKSAGQERGQPGSSSVPPPPVSVNPVCGRELSAICMKALEQDPNLRYPTARGLGEEIRRFREFLPVSAVRPRVVDRVANWIRRRKPAAAALVTLALAALGVAGFSLSRSYLDARTLRSMFVLVEESRGDIERLQADVAGVRTSIEAAGGDTEEGRLRGQALADLEARLEVKQWELRGRLGAVIGLTLASPDPLATQMARDQVLSMVEEARLRGDRPSERAQIEWALGHYEKGNILGFRMEEVAKLRSMLVRVD